MKTKINRIKSLPKTHEAHVEEPQSRESVLSHLMNVSEVGLCSLDTNMRYIYINDWLADINGLPAEDHIGRSIRELFPDLADGIEKQFQQVIDTGDPIIKGRVYLETRNSPGIKRLFEHNYYANKSADGTVLGISCYVEDITERDRVDTAEREKQASDMRFRLLVERMVDGVGTLDKAGVITFANETACRMFGYTREDMLGRTIFDLVDEENKRILQQNFKARHDGEKRPYEIQALKKNGQTFDLQITPQPLFDENGNFSGSLAVLRDITEQKKSERALRESKERLRRQAEELELLYQTAPVGLCLLDTELRYLHINEVLAEINGAPISEHIGKRLREVIPELGEEVETLCNEILNRGEPVTGIEFKGRIPADAPSERDFVCNFYPLKGTDGEAYALSIVVQEVTEQKRAESALRESEAKFHAIFDNAGLAMVIVDDEKTIVQVNKAMCDMLDYSEEELVGKNYLMIKLEEDRETSLKTYETVQSSNVSRQHFERRYRKSDGSFTWGAVAASKFKDKKNESYTIGMIQDITERKLTETALRKSEEKFKAIFDNAAVSMAIVNDSKTIVQVNRSMCEMLEYSEEELIGKSFLDITVEDDRKLSLETYNNLKYSDKIIQRHEKRYRKSDGSIIWGLVAASKLYDNNGESFTVGMVQDITERKQAETALHESEAKFHAIFDRAGMAMAIVDDSKTMVQVNKAMCDMLKYSEKELVGKSFLDITIEEDRNISVNAFDTLQRTGDDIQRFEKRYRNSDGSISWGLVAISQFHDAEDKSFRIGMIQDITERKLAETALRESEERLRQLVENLNEFVYLFDMKKMGVVYASPAYEKVYGRDPELLKDNPLDWENAVHPEDLERVLAEFENFMEEESADLTYRVVHPDGSIHWIHDRCFPIYDDKGDLTRFAGVAEDITGRKMREERIDKQNRRLRQLVEERSQQALNSERMASVGRLTAGYTHQIRNPLQSIFCNIDRISALISGNSPAFREIDSMRGHLQRIADVAKQMRYVYRPQESKITIFNVNDVITEAVDLYFNLLSDAGIKISLDLCQPAAYAASDETAVYTAMGNLILNARDAMPDGGSLKIKTTIEDGKVKLSVADTGHGIPEDIMPSIFDPFFTTKPPDEGTGLGLTVVKESLENCGGSIMATSNPGSGAVFTIHLPVKQEA